MRQTTRRAATLATAIGAALASLAAQAAEFATVVSSTPVIVSVPVPRQQCSDSQQLVQQRSSGAGALVGAIAGGVIGHNLGNGFGRAAATGFGAVAGAVVGDQIEAANSPVAEVPVRRCQTVSSYENRTVGYDVIYDYAGQRYSARMAHDPGRQLAVNVQPAEGGGAPAPTDYGREGTPVPLNQAPQQPAYYAPLQPVYYAPPPVYVTPVIGFGVGYYGGYRGRWR